MAAELGVAGQPGAGLESTRELIAEAGVARRAQRDVVPAAGVAGVDRDLGCAAHVDLPVGTVRVGDRDDARTAVVAGTGGDAEREPAARVIGLYVDPHDGVSRAGEVAEETVWTVEAEVVRAWVRRGCVQLVAGADRVAVGRAGD